MSSEIATLQCPKCGNSDNTGSQERRFGFEFKCSYCSAVSVLIINRQLYIPAPGEHVCLQCGKVARPDARFCQCGLSLIIQCISCLKEFPRDHALCDYCGWPQAVERNTAKGYEVRRNQALEVLKGVDPNRIVFALRELRQLPTTPEEVDGVVSLYRRFRNPPGLPGLLWEEVLIALGKCGTAAAIPFFEDWSESVRNNAYVSEHEFRLLGCCGEKAIPVLIEAFKKDDVGWRAVEGFVMVGPSAIPHLRSLTGLFSSGGLKSRAAQTISLIERSQYPPKL